MKRFVLRSVGALGCVFGVASSAAAEDGGGGAAGAATAGKVQLSAEVQYGVAMGDGADPYQLGFGAEAGYTLPSGLYLGAAFDYFLGEEATLLSVTAKVNAWTLMAEVGWDVGVADAVVLRPKLGLGVHTPGVQFCTEGEPCDDGYSENHFAFAPAVQLVWVAGPLLVSSEVRFNVDAQATDGSGFTFGIGIGAAF